MFAPFDFFGHQDHAHAGAPDGHAFGGFGLDGLAEAEPLHEESDGGGLSAGEDEPVDLGEVFGAADLFCLEPRLVEAGERLEVFGEVALDGGYSDRLRHGASLSRVLGLMGDPSRIRGMVELIGAPFDLCGPVLGSRLGPTAMRLLGVESKLRRLGVEIADVGDAFELGSGAPVDGRVRAREAVVAYRALKAKVLESYGRGATPVVVSGDHSLALATISAALEVYGEDLAVLWIDAHMDLNTPSTSPSGNLHGMPLGAVMRLAPGVERYESQAGAFEVWPTLLSEVVPSIGLAGTKAAWVGLRDVDPGEVANYRAVGGEYAYTMQDVDRLGISGVMSLIPAWLAQVGATKLWVSFDVDALDPLLAPGTGTTVRGGLSYREGHYVAEYLYEFFKSSLDVSLAGVDVVEVNPMTDRAGETAQVATEWLGSLFGESIMGVPV